MSHILVKKLNGDLLEIDISSNDTERTIIERIHTLYPDDFPKNFTHISRKDNMKGRPFENEELVMCHIDYDLYYVEFPLICPIPSSLDTCIFEDIPNRLVKIIERDIQDKYRIQKYMKIEWIDMSERVREGYVPEP